MISFTIPYPPTKKGKAAFCKRFGLNAYYGKKQWGERTQDAREMHMLATASMRKARVRKELVSGPVEIRFYWNDGMDVDNHAIIGKMVTDAMKGYILPNDNRKWVRKVSHEFWDGGCIRVEIETL